MEVREGLCLIMRTALGEPGGKTGYITVESLRDSELNSQDLQIVPRFRCSWILHPIWSLGMLPSAPAVLVCGERVGLILPPCPVTEEQGGVMKSREGVLCLNGLNVPGDY